MSTFKLALVRERCDARAEDLLRIRIHRQEKAAWGPGSIGTKNQRKHKVFVKDRIHSMKFNKTNVSETASASPSEGRHDCKDARKLALQLKSASQRYQTGKADFNYG